MWEAVLSTSAETRFLRADEKLSLDEVMTRRMPMETFLEISFEVPETIDDPSQVLRPLRLRPTRSNAVSTQPQLDGQVDALVPIARDPRTEESLAPHDRPAQGHFFDVW